ENQERGTIPVVPRRGSTMRLSRIALFLGLSIIPSVTVVETATAGGTNEARLTGLRLFAAGQFQQAIPHFDEVLASHKRDLEVLNKRGACYIRVNEPEKALADFDNANRHAAWSSRMFGPADILSPLSSWRSSSAPVVTIAESWGNRGIALLM